MPKKYPLSETAWAKPKQGLRVILGELEDMPKIAEQWERLPELDRVDYSLQWDHLMASYLTELDEFYRAGELSAEQQARYHELRRNLSEALPTIERLNLYYPPVPLEA